MNMSEMGQLQAINRLVGSVAERDLNLLNAIDKTIDVFCARIGEMKVLTKVTYNFIEDVKKLEQPIDESGEAVADIEKTRETLAQVHANLSSQCERIQRSGRVDSEDGLIEVYREMIDSVAALHNATNALIWAVGEHDADFDESTGEIYDSVEEMLTALKR